MVNFALVLHLVAGKMCEWKKKKQGLNIKKCVVYLNCGSIFLKQNFKLLGLFDMRIFFPPLEIEKEIEKGHGRYV